MPSENCIADGAQWRRTRFECRVNAASAFGRCCCKKAFGPRQHAGLIRPRRRRGQKDSKLGVREKERTLRRRSTSPTLATLRPWLQPPSSPPREPLLTAVPAAGLGQWRGTRDQSGNVSPSPSVGATDAWRIQSVSPTDLNRDDVRIQRTLPSGSPSGKSRISAERCSRRTWRSVPFARPMTPLVATERSVSR